MMNMNMVEFYKAVKIVEFIFKKNYFVGEFKLVKQTSLNYIFEVDGFGKYSIAKPIINEIVNDLPKYYK